MSRIRVLAPGLGGYREPLGAAFQDPAAYARYWEAVPARAAAVLADAVGAAGGPGPTLLVRRSEVRGRFNRYTQIDVDTLERPIEAIVLRFQPHHLATSAPPTIHPGAASVIECRIYDHGVFILEVEADVTVPPDCDEGEVPGLLDQLQHDAVTWGEALACEVHDRYLTPLLRLLRSGDPHAEVVSKVERLVDDKAEHGRVLWVTRSLLLSPDEPLASELARYWIKDAVGDVDLDARLAPVDGRVQTHVVRWLNYLFVGPDLSAADDVEGVFPDEWSALRLAQYFYAALENVDAQLTRVLAYSLAPLPVVSVAQLQAELEECSRRAQFIVMQMRDVSKYLTRSVRAELGAILECWELDEVVVEPVTMKVEACERRLRELAEKRTARASVFTDTILLGIGITSILGTTIALTEFGRTMAVDPGMAGFDNGQSGLMGWFAGQPADLLVMASIGVSMLLAVVYFYFRRFHQR
ncbi:hypothetical protein [Nocardioides sp. LHG3406-4]|uniref:hypothetical protein n=1 Tax=Nocardioides sp. LHG3406-4 TaxID=2804575 RepID=UPI003CEF90F3